MENRKKKKAFFSNCWLHPLKEKASEEIKISFSEYFPSFHSSHLWKALKLHYKTHSSTPPDSWGTLGTLKDRGTCPSSSHGGHLCCLILLQNQAIPWEGTEVPDFQSWEWAWSLEGQCLTRQSTGATVTAWYKCIQPPSKSLYFFHRVLCFMQFRLMQENCNPQGSTRS